MSPVSEGRGSGENPFNRPVKPSIPNSCENDKKEESSEPILDIDELVKRIGVLLAFSPHNSDNSLSKSSSLLVKKIQLLQFEILDIDRYDGKNIEVLKIDTPSRQNREKASFELSQSIRQRLSPVSEGRGSGENLSCRIFSGFSFHIPLFHFLFLKLSNFRIYSFYQFINI